MRFLTVSLATLFICLCSGAINAQEAFSAGSGYSEDSGGSISFSVGLTSYTGITSTAGSVSQGVQHAYKAIVLAIDDSPDNLFSFVVYPNPTHSWVTLKVENHPTATLSFHLWDAYGKLLLRQHVTGQETVIPMESLPPSIYFIRVDDKDKEVKTFRIMKVGSRQY